MNSWASMRNMGVGVAASLTMLPRASAEKRTRQVLEGEPAGGSVRLLVAPAARRGEVGPRLFVPCAVVFAAALALRLAYAYTMPVRISADAAYYMSVAENLYRGRGLVVDYVWNYLAPPGVPAGLPVPSNGYWMPLTSFVIAGAFGAAGSTAPRVAQAPFLALGALLCAITAWIAGLLFRSRAAALAAGAMAVISFQLVGVSLFPDHFNLAACLVNLALLAFWAAWWRDPRLVVPPGSGGDECRRWWRVTALACLGGLSGGLAYLTRSDGALVLVVGLVPSLALLRAGRARLALGQAAAAMGAAGAVVCPWLVRQKLTFGTFWGAGPLRTAFLTDYNDLFRVDLSRLTLPAYLKANQVVTWGFKGYVLMRELRLLGAVLGLAGLLALCALRHRDLRRRASPWLIYGALAVLVPALLFPYPTIKGGFWHLLPGLCPIAFSLAGGEAVELLRRAKPQERSARRALGIAALALSFVYLGAWWAAAPGDVRRGAPALYPVESRAALRKLDPPPTAVLTDDSWGLYHVARVPCAQFPSDGAEAALLVADRLGADYLVTLADAPQRIPAMSQILGHPRFRPVARHPTPGPALLIYRILPPPGEASQAPSERSLRMSQ